MKRFFVGGITLYMTLSACEKKAELNVPYEGDRIVVNSFIQPDSPVYIRVTKSVPVTVYSEDQFPTLSSAQVHLLENGNDVGVLQWQEIKGKGYFVSKRPAARGNRYTIKVANEGLTPVEASDTIPAVATITNAYAQRNANRVSFLLEDWEGVDNYYRIRLFKADEDAAALGIIRPKATVAYRLDPTYNTVFLAELTSSYYNTLLIGDSRFDGRKIQFVLQTQDVINDKYIIAEISALSESAYHYLQTAGSQGGITGLVVSEPTRVFSNVQNGYGIVAGINTRQLLLKVE
ncbi:DUF4249 domain-containing protein [Chitinophaga pendula]|uniref:DUF4249 domain-containing protein n=1 Tax=Chitinophaga TaxID=79328 RepID=UPI0012FD7BCD|nr:MULTISPECIES: DUF4249 domain-containing protein [Chitinophaga]UCJ07321.1 DUF4249 domain-containing protein [Chitinophaga pendula]